ncbi:MAG: hypothetical protein GY953_05520, partial [bacterium]|nr:hypothetical protein [bacterium]
MKRTTILSMILAALAVAASAQTPQQPERDHTADRILKAVDDLMWHVQLGDVA